jgi:hypothetical protein
MLQRLRSTQQQGTAEPPLCPRIKLRLSVIDRSAKFHSWSYDFVYAPRIATRHPLCLRGLTPRLSLCTEAADLAFFRITAARRKAIPVTVQLNPPRLI